MTFEEKLIKAHKKGYKILLWDSVEWSYQQVEDVRKATKEDAKMCHQFDEKPCKVGDLVIEINDDCGTMKPIECISECDTIIVQEIDIDTIK